jgi:hypothetical protein
MSDFDMESFGGLCQFSRPGSGSNSIGRAVDHFLISRLTGCGWASLGYDAQAICDPRRLGAG